MYQESLTEIVERIQQIDTPQTSLKWNASLNVKVYVLENGIPTPENKTNDIAESLKLVPIDPLASRASQREDSLNTLKYKPLKARMISSKTERKIVTVLKEQTTTTQEKILWRAQNANNQLMTVEDNLSCFPSPSDLLEKLNLFENNVQNLVTCSLFNKE